MRVLIVSVLFVAGLVVSGCEKKTEEAPAPEAKAEVKAETTSKPITAELWVEVKAHEQAAAPTGEDLKKLGPEAIYKSRDAVYKKFGVTKEAMDTFYNQLSETDAAKAGKLALQANEEAAKLRQK